MIVNVDLDTALSLGGRVKKITGISKKKDGTQTAKGHRVYLAVATDDPSVLSRATDTGLGFADFLLWRGEEEPQISGTRLAGKTSWVLPSLSHLDGFEDLGAVPVFPADVSSDLRVLQAASIQCPQLRIVGEPVLRVPGIKTGFLEELSSTDLVVCHPVSLPLLEEIGEYQVITTRVKEPRGERPSRKSSTQAPRTPQPSVVDELFGASRVSF